VRVQAAGRDCHGSSAGLGCAVKSEIERSDKMFDLAPPVVT